MSDVVEVRLPVKFLNAIGALVAEIAQTDYRCSGCGRAVNAEIRIYDPPAMYRLSHQHIERTMRESDAGYIPFCFRCLRNNSFLKPHWLP